MAYEQILYDVSEKIATITLNRPEFLNAWTLQMGLEVRHAMWTADRDPEVRVIVVTGAGKGYCAGADMNLLQGLQRGEAGGLSATDDLKVDFDPDIPETFRGEYSYPLGLSKPVIGAINGVAAGLGVSYQLYYDMRIASDRARFSMIFSRRGLIAEHGSAWFLPRLIGPSNAADLLYSGRFVDADEAHRLGLVNRVVPHDDLMKVVRETATELATLCSPRSIRIMKRQLFGDLGSDLGTSMRHADQQMIACFGTDDFREGVASFLERRKPNFTGK